MSYNIELSSKGVKMTGSKLGQGNKNITLKVREHLPPSVTSVYSCSKVTHQIKLQRGCFNCGFILECILILYLASLFMTFIVYPKLL